MPKTANCSLFFPSVSVSFLVESADRSANAGHPASSRNRSSVGSFRLPAQMLRIMRLITFLLIAACLSAHANSVAQTVTLSGKDMSLKQVFTAIEKQTGYVVFNKKGLLADSKSVSLTVYDMPLSDLLSAVLKDQPVKFVIQDKTIILSRKSPAVYSDQPALSPQPAAEAQPVWGRVVDSSGKAIQGASIRLMPGNKGVSSSADGSFVIANVEPGPYTLEISFVGFETVKRKITVSGSGSFAVGTVVLQVSNSPLDEVQIMAYGTTSQRFSTGNISTVKAADIEKQPVMNPLVMLQGRVPGLLVTQTNGFASAPVKLDIRGIGNLAQATEPLYIIDGVPLSVLLESNNGLSQTAFGGTRSTAGGESPLFNINPNDIESMSVLTGADATAIYGSRGANGVILITTKRGKVGPTRFDVNLTQGVSKITRYWDMLNTQQYLEMRREALKNDGLTPTPTNAPDLTVWDTTRYTNWQKESMGHAGKVTKVSAGISGGDQQTLFRINADYNRMTDITTKSGSTQRMAFSFNIDHSSTNKKFSVLLSGNYAYSNINLVPISLDMLSAPNAPPIFNAKGDPNWEEWNNRGLVNLYPYSRSLTSTSEKSNFLTSNLRFNYRPLRGLVFSVNLGYNLNYNTTNYFEPISSKNPYQSATGQANFNKTNNRGWIIEPQASYHTVLGAGKLDVTVGGTYNNVSTLLSSQYGLGYTDDNLLYSINNAQSIYASDASALYKYGGAFGIIKYNLEDRYIINLNGRRDGSSRFGPGKQYGNFGSVGAAWIASEEKWFKKALPGFINFFKFKAGYGILGSDGGVGDYQYLSLWSSSINYNILPTYGGIQPYQPYNPPNQNFHWATNKNLDAGVEIGLLKDNNIYLEIRYYLNRTSNQLTNNPLPDFTGFSSLLQNLPATIQNKGWEGRLNATLIEKKDFRWTAGFNISINKNKLVAFPGLANSPYSTRYVVGDPLNTRYVYHYLGIDPLNGQYAFKDQNNDGQLTGAGDVPGISNPDAIVRLKLDPQYFGGFSTMFTYKALSLGLDFSYKKQIGVNAYSSSSGRFGLLNRNVPQEVFDNHWRKPGDNAQYPAFTTQYNMGYFNFYYSDGTYSDASYVRLNNASLYYSLPAKWLKKAGVKDCRLYVNAQNVFVITKYKGIDPETQNFGGMPPVKVYTGGVTFNF